ncbi:IS3 family transposase [Spiribacter roseus]|uniref:IS3 family transposase n=1 Tax=Spiribacter roseus TaxID=1855875 RepID=UPI00132FFD26|nr:IS3 family transposase [Spiribacter roseus]KAF0284745.1 transposase [Spiribacter roseus]
MYSYEDRKTAVELYIQYRRDAAATVRALGYPSKKGLRRWYQAFIEAGHMPQRTRWRTRYSAEARQKAVDHYFSTGQCAARTIRELGYPSRRWLRAWVRGEKPTAARVGRANRDGASSRQYTASEKTRAVIDFSTRATSAAEVARRVGVNRVSLYNWRDQLLGKEAKRSPVKRQDDNANDGDPEALRAEVKALEKRVHELQLEHDILVKASEIVKKDHGVNPQTLSNREKTLLVDALKDAYRRSELLKAVQLPRSSYYYQREALQRPDKYAEARQATATTFESNYRCYGYRRIGESLRRDGVALSEKVVRRLMSEEGLIVGSTQRRRLSSYRGELSPVPENIIARDFQSPAPNEKWLTDITEFPVPDGKVYLSPMIDCFDGLAVSWSISASPNAELVNAMLDEAISTLAPGERPVVHSDRGCHYRWPGWLKRLEAAGLTRSMSRKGCTPDNAACEAFFGRLKVEFFYARQWTGTTMEQFIAERDAYVRWYNETRIKMSLGGRSPIEYRQALGIAA